MTDSPSIRVFSVDDHPLMREGIAAIINVQPDMTLVAQAENGTQAVQRFREHRPDVTLMDLQLPDIGGIETMITILGECPDAKVVVLTTFEGDADIKRALAAGARAYVLKSTPPSELANVIRRVYGGKKHIPPNVAAQLAEHVGDEALTQRETTVLEHVADGNRHRDIARRLVISEETVKVHLKHIMEKLGASDRTQAMTIALRRGIIRL